MNGNSFDFSYPPPNTFPITAPPPPMNNQPPLPINSPPPLPPPPPPETSTSQWAWGMQERTTINMDFINMPPPSYIPPMRQNSNNIPNNYDQRQNNQNRYPRPNYPNNSYNSQRYDRYSVSMEVWRSNQFNQSFNPMYREGAAAANGYQNKYRMTRPPEAYDRPKKRKKPLSRSLSARRAWTEEEAKLAFDVEKELNKTANLPTIKITVPDEEITKEFTWGIVPNTIRVRYNQPLHPRSFCVTLGEQTNIEETVEMINQIKFNNGFLKAEYKKDKEDELNIGPEDIDPFTLYVGNLVQDVTKDDMCKMFPKYRRIDIGYAKKMKFTRYAFVSFRNVNDAIEAFKQTYSKDMHSRSLILRFRRLHGTVGMPGEPKIQNSPSDSRLPIPPNLEDNRRRDETDDEVFYDSDGWVNHQPFICKYEQPEENTSSPEDYDRSDHTTRERDNGGQEIDTSIVKTEPVDVKPFITPFLPESELIKAIAEVERRRRDNPHIPFVEPKQEPQEDQDEPEDRLLSTHEIKKEENDNDVEFW